MSTVFDTLQYTKGAEQVGIKREHAEYQAQQLVKFLDYNVVTKADFTWLEKSFDEKLKNTKNEMILKLGSLMLVGMTVLGFILKH